MAFMSGSFAKFRRLTIVSVVLLAVLVTLYSLNTAGVCVKRGKVLSELELRKAVLRSLVQNSMDRANLNFAYDNNEHYRSGIIRIPSQTPLPELLDEFFNNGKSFEENFKIEVIAPRDRGFSFDSLQEPFVLVDYGLIHHSTVHFRASEDIYKVEISGRQQKDSSYPVVELSEWSKKWLMFRPYLRLLGFGNHYYQMKRTAFLQDCCDNRRYRHRYPSEKDYLDHKRLTYERSKKWLADDDRIFLRGIAQVSNCGDILTYKEEDTGLGLPSIRWLGATGK